MYSSFRSSGSILLILLNVEAESARYVRTVAVCPFLSVARLVFISRVFAGVIIAVCCACCFCFIAVFFFIVSCFQLYRSRYCSVPYQVVHTGALVSFFLCVCLVRFATGNPARSAYIRGIFLSYPRPF